MHSYVTRNPLYTIVFTKLGFAVVSVIKMIRFFFFCCSFLLRKDRHENVVYYIKHGIICSIMFFQKRTHWGIVTSYLTLSVCKYSEKSQTYPYVSIYTDVIPVFFYLANEMSGFHVCWQLSNMQKWSVSKNRDFHFHFWIITGNYKIVAGKWKMELTMLLCLEIEQLF